MLDDAIKSFGTVFFQRTVGLQGVPEYAVTDDHIRCAVPSLFAVLCFPALKPENADPGYNAGLHCQSYQWPSGYLPWVTSRAEC
mgnify:CR=1 FL=1